MSDLYEFVVESNRIEGILREPTDAELEAHETFLALSQITVPAVADFVYACAGASLRSQPGMDVRVGRHVPQRGGPDIPLALEGLLAEINRHVATPYEAHVRYEKLHPFMDGNGRSGRVIWAWQMARDLGGPDPFALGFLHRFYYQALDGSRRGVHV